MQLKPIDLKYTSLFYKIIFSISLLFLSDVYSQNSKKIKIDGVSAVVGDYVILNSDIDKTFVEMESEGISILGVSRCEILEKLMKDKLFTHHAIQDSVDISDSEVYDYVDQSIEYFTEQLGSLEVVL
jgi:peptidyl-prolyl cis-trans isomerase SurA